jgi:hypothetical protein
MATIHQIDANRLNARKSTGPRSAHGKAASSRNALKSGIDAQSQVIRGEKPEDLDALAAEYLDRFQPSTPEQRLYVDTLVRDDWQLRRLAKVDAQIWEYQITNFFSPDDDAPLGHAFANGDRHFERLQRRLNATERSYKSALRELQQLQSSGDTQRHSQPAPAPAPKPQETKDTNSQIGFVPPLPPQPAPAPSTFVPVFGFVPPPSPSTPSGPSGPCQPRQPQSTSVSRAARVLTAAPAVRHAGGLGCVGVLLSLAQYTRRCETKISRRRAAGGHCARG